MLTASVEVLWTARYDYKYNWKLVPHAHDYFQMIYFLGGSGSLFLANRDYQVRPGDLFLIKPHNEHALAPHSSLKTLDLKFRVYDADLHQNLLKATNRITEKGAALVALFEHIRWEGEAANYLYRESCNLSLLQILIHYLRRDRHEPDSGVAELGQEELPNDDVVRRALEFIRCHYAEDVDLLRIANTVQRSDRHIRQHFEECLGMPPMRYLVQYRIRRAKELIQYSDYALKEIAELVGFKTIHHFTRVFREVAGESPGAWRRKYRAGICKDVCIHPHFSNVNRTFPRSSLCLSTD